MERAQERDPEARYDIVLADEKSSHLIERDHPLTVALAEAIQSVTGSAAAYGGGSWLADTASFGNLVPTVIFGPGREPVYMPNEWLADRGHRDRSAGLCRDRGNPACAR